MLIPDSADAVLFLFLYPDPPSTILIESTTNFLPTDCRECLPIPYDVRYTVLIPEIASPCVLCNLTVVLSIVETKYDELVTKPTIPLWSDVL